MGRSKTAGISTDRHGNKVINKQIDGRTLFKRLGNVTQEYAEAELARLCEEHRQARDRGIRPRRTFAAAAERYLLENGHLSSIESAAYHIADLLPFIGSMPLNQIHDGTLAPFIKARRASGVTDTTVSRALEVVRRILRLAALKWRDEHHLSWLEHPPLISVRPDPKPGALPYQPRKAYALDFEEQDHLFSKLPAFNRDMALFKVNTGCREHEVCCLEWAWEIKLPELSTSVFLIPALFDPEQNRGVKNRMDRLVVLNKVAMEVVEAQRGKHPQFVFTRHGRPVQKMNNTAWQRARREAEETYKERFKRPAPAGFGRVRVHDLKHTFGRRLRAAGVSQETRMDLLGHKSGSMTTHYSLAELEELLAAVNRIDASRGTPTLLMLRSMLPAAANDENGVQVLQKSCKRKTG